MKSLLFALGIGIVAATAGISAASVSWLFWDAWKSSDLEAFRAIVGAFAGAFFAYVFVRFGDALKKVYDRKEANHTALVRLQHYFNDCLNITGDNIFIADNCMEVFSDARLASADVPIFMNTYHQYPIDREVVSRLTNIDFLNEVYSLNISLQKMNASLATIDGSYSQLRDALLAKTIDISTYKDNALEYRKRSLEMKGFLLQFKGDLIRLFATTNILMEDRPFLVRVTQSLVRTTYPKDFERRLPVEQERVSGQIEAFAKASAKKIREAQGK